ncbi:FMRFamide-like neuropeptide 18 isoform X2 [Tigriopus californicus]|nr:FMRFamide-like neuropeptide 18 isoform X2 [Tigriopus californicus]
MHGVYFVLLLILQVVSSQSICELCSPDCSALCDLDSLSFLECCQKRVDPGVLAVINEALLKRIPEEALEFSPQSELFDDEANYDPEMSLQSVVPHVDLIRVGRGGNNRLEFQDLTRLGKRNGQDQPEVTAISWRKRLTDSLRLGKRSNSYKKRILDGAMRLGKRAGLGDSMRLGKRYPITDSMRLGKRPALTDSMRFGKRPALTDSMRLGKRQSVGDSMRLGKRSDVVDSIRLGKRESLTDSIRLGKREPLTDSIRLGKREPLTDSIRLGKREPLTDSIRLGKREPLTDSMRLGKRLMTDAMLFGKRAPLTESSIRLGRSVGDSMRLGKRSVDEEI